MTIARAFQRRHGCRGRGDGLLRLFLIRLFRVLRLACGFSLFLSLLFGLLFPGVVAVVRGDCPGRVIVVRAFALCLRDGGLHTEGQENRGQNQNFFHSALYFQT